MKPDNKLGKLRFDAEEAFENLRAKAKKILAVSKEELEQRLRKESGGKISREANSVRK
jgi:hypothetical protein